MNKLYLIVVFLFFNQLFAQSLPSYKLSQVSVDSLQNPFSGGFNAPQFSQMHLNNDDFIDLVAFDRIGNKFFTYLATKVSGEIVYNYAPQYEWFFPRGVENWALLYDYDLDNKPDLFCNTVFGIKTYKNTTVGDFPNWMLIKDPILAEIGSQLTNILVNSTDLPALSDIDGDGDMDILSFNAFTGSKIEFYKNQSIDIYGHADSLIFKLVDNCFGGLEELNCGSFNFGLICQTAKIGLNRTQHVGSSSILAFDPDGDGDKDLLISKGECLKISYLQNVGDKLIPKYKSATYGYPNALPANFYVFPSAFWLDLNADGKKDLLVTPQSANNASRLIDTRNTNWLYRNTAQNSTAQYVQLSKNYIQNTNIDLGENAAPTLVDYDFDGDLDLIVGNKGTKINDSTYAATLHLYKNIGTKTTASFTLETQDFLGLANYKMSNLIPQFIDFDRNGTLDLLLTTTNYNQLNKTQLVQITNKNNDKFNFDFTAIDTIDVPINIEDVPFVLDEDGDGDMDVLIGKVNGALLTYENNNENYSLKTNGLGGLVSNPFKKYLVCQINDFNLDGQQDLIYGDNTGQIRLVTNYKQKTKFDKADSSLIYNELNKKMGDFTFAERMLISTGDLNSDKIPDIMVGGNTGGLWLLLSEKNLDLPSKWQISLLNNPVSNLLNLSSNQEFGVDFFNMMGQYISSHYFENAQSQWSQINTSQLAKGLYILKIYSRGEYQSFKLIKE